MTGVNADSRLSRKDTPHMSNPIGRARNAWRGANPIARMTVYVAGLLIVVVFVGTAAMLTGSDTPTPPVNAAATTAAPTHNAAATHNAAPVATKPAKPALTTAQRNAAKQAQNYIDLTGFSRSGLIKQLAFDGFSTADATAGVDSINVDWMVQATRKAADYMALTAFSRSGLIKQLMFDGFTAAQAAHGADSVGL
jgi:hypothetical protein